jgi:hypothetical protein
MTHTATHREARSRRSAGVARRNRRHTASRNSSTRAAPARWKPDVTARNADPLGNGAGSHAHAGQTAERGSNTSRITTMTLMAAA